MAKNESTSKRVAKVASKLLKNPSSATLKDIKTVAGTALTQVTGRKK